jgi:mannose/fructose/N-acetylgalactosamine-specific phosphotransferase system component IID
VVNGGAVVMVTLLVGVGVLWAFSSGAKTGRRVERQAKEITRAGSVAGFSVMAGLVIAVVQWAVLAHVTNPSLTTLALVLDVPGLLAGTTIGRLFAVTTSLNGASRKGARR